MAGKRSSSSDPTQDEWAEAIGGDLADQLDEFAFQRERVLDKLDIRSAKLARTLAMELRALRRALGSQPSNLDEPATRSGVLAFRQLKVQARDLLAGKVVREIISTPPTSGERDLDSDPDEITAQRTPESMRTSGKKQR